MNFLIVLFLIVAAIFSRFLPHPPNFTPVIAVMLFSGTYFKKGYALFIPLTVMLVSDACIGFYDVCMMVAVYASLGLVTLFGAALNKRFAFSGVMYYSLLGSILFFIVTNFAVWAFGSMYPMTFAGLVECYTLAIPFFENALGSTLVYGAVLFGIYELKKAVFEMALA